MLNFNTEISIQKPKLAFQNKNLINFLVASILSTYKGVIDNFNIQDTLILDGAVCALHTKKTELINLGVIKKESIYFATQKRFCGGQKSRGKAKACIITQTLNGDYAVQGYSLWSTINCFHCKKNGHGWKDCDQYLANKKGKRWKASDKGKL